MFKGKTLWELGLIKKLEVDYARGQHVADQEDLFSVLREHRISSRASLEIGLASGLPPFVKIIFADGTSVSTDRYEALITPPDGQPFRCILHPPVERAKPIQADFLHIRFEEGLKNKAIKVQVGDHELLGGFSTTPHLRTAVNWKIPLPEEKVMCIISSISADEEPLWKGEITVSKGKYLLFSLSEGKIEFTQLPQPYFLYNDGQNKSNKSQ